MMRAEPLELVVFDLDGVLVDSSPAHAAAFSELYRALGVPGRPYPEIAGRSTRSVVAELLGPDADRPDVLDTWVHFKQSAARRYLERSNMVFPDSAITLDALRGLGVTIAVGTSASRATADAVLGAAGWNDRFAAVVTADDVAHAKPDPAIYTEAIARAGGSPERTVVVEDSVTGLLAGIASGAWVISVRTGAVVPGARFLGTSTGLARVVELVADRAAWTASS